MAVRITNRELFGRRLVTTDADPIPRAMRAMPGCVAMNHRELAEMESELRAGRGRPTPVTARLVATLQIEDGLDTQRPSRWAKWRKRLKRARR